MKRDVFAKSSQFIEGGCLNEVRDLEECFKEGGRGEYPWEEKKSHVQIWGFPKVNTDFICNNRLSYENLCLCHSDDLKGGRI